MNLIDRLRKRPSFLTTKEVMQLLGKTRNTVCHWACAGRLPATRVGHEYLFDPNDIADWLEQRQTAPSKPRIQQNSTEFKRGLSKGVMTQNR